MTGQSFASFRAGAPSLRRGIPIGTGAPWVDASADFHRARRAYIAARAISWLTSRRPGRALPRALNDLRTLSWTGRRLRVIPLKAIVGTVEATTDFDAHFRPTTNRVSARWQRIALAQRRGSPLPPITVIQRPDGYYVVDGRHRVSVARAIRHTDIEAWVSPAVRPSGTSASGL
jgi:hypothetical protein